MLVQRHCASVSRLFAILIVQAWLPAVAFDIAKANGHYFIADALMSARLSDEEIEGVAKGPQGCLWKSVIVRQDVTLL